MEQTEDVFVVDMEENVFMNLSRWILLSYPQLRRAQISTFLLYPCYLDGSSFLRVPPYFVFL